MDIIKKYDLFLYTKKLVVKIIFIIYQRTKIFTKDEANKTITLTEDRTSDTDVKT